MKMNMKMSAALATLVLTHAAYAVDGYSHPVTVALTQSVEGEQNESQTFKSKTVDGVETSTTTTNFSNKIVSTKIGNKEVLEELLDLDAFPEGVRTISGYSIQLFVDTDGDPVGLFAVKAGAAPVALDDFLTVELGDGISAASGNTVATVKGTDDTLVQNSSFKNTDIITVELNDGAATPITLVSVQGIANSAGKFAFNDTKDPVIDLTTISSISGSNLTGALVDAAAVSVFQGSFKAGAGKKITLPL
jgi:hypothetical protein